jgi:hypothetical protein
VCVCVREELRKSCNVMYNHQMHKREREKGKIIEEVFCRREWKGREGKREEGKRKEENHPARLRGLAFTKKGSALDFPFCCLCSSA